MKQKKLKKQTIIISKSKVYHIAFRPGGFDNTSMMQFLLSG